MRCGGMADNGKVCDACVTKDGHAFPGPFSSEQQAHIDYEEWRTDLHIVVAGLNANGDPDLYFVILTSVSHGQIDFDEHYAFAREQAQDHGYEEPLVAFDAKVDCLGALEQLFTWETASRVSMEREP